MKKMSRFVIIYLSLLCLNAKGDGYFTFASGGTRILWENFTTAGPIVPAPAGSINVAFLIGTGTPLIGTAGSPTNAESTGNWAVIFSDPNFHFATNANSGQLAIASTVNNGPVQGTFLYNSGVSFPVAGTIGSTTKNVFAVAWPSVYATPQTAAQSGSVFGWSNTFPYISGFDQGDFTLDFIHSGMTPFGLVVPEPSALSLAGLGVGLMFLRRK
jgi:hypothetical protein